MSNDNVRVILALAAEVDDDFIWDQLKAIQPDMFAAGPVSVKFAYFGAEGGLSSRPCITTHWVTDSDDMADLMEKGRARCVCGCYVDVGDILTEALKESRLAPVQAVIIVGDHFHGKLDEAIAHAKQLRAAGTRLFLFQQGRSAQTEEAFRALAEQTGGAYFQFNPAVERVAERLPATLGAVTALAVGGIAALESRSRDNDEVADLLEQLTANALLNASRADGGLQG